MILSCGWDKRKSKRHELPSLLAKPKTDVQPRKILHFVYKCEFLANNLEELKASIYPWIG